MIVIITNVTNDEQYVGAQFFGMMVGMAILRASTPAIWHNASTGLAVPNCLAANQIADGLSPGNSTQMMLFI
jgi:hypothetical protein